MTTGRWAGGCSGSGERGLGGALLHLDALIWGEAGCRSSAAPAPAYQRFATRPISPQRRSNVESAPLAGLLPLAGAARRPRRPLVGGGRGADGRARARGRDQEAARRDGDARRRFCDGAHAGGVACMGAHGLAWARMGAWGHPGAAVCKGAGAWGRSGAHGRMGAHACGGSCASGGSCADMAPKFKRRRRAPVHRTQPWRRCCASGPSTRAGDARPPPRASSASSAAAGGGPAAARGSQLARLWTHAWARACFGRRRGRVLAAPPAAPVC